MYPRPEIKRYQKKVSDFLPLNGTPTSDTDAELLLTPGIGAHNTINH